MKNPIRLLFTYKNLDKDQLLPIAEALVDRLTPGHVVFLDGEMGMGKSTFVRMVLTRMSEKSGEKNLSAFASPTYSIIHEYQFRDQEVAHIDLYRLESIEDLFQTGIEEMVSLKTKILFIEWGDRFPEFKEKILGQPNPTVIKLQASELEQEHLRNLEIWGV